MKKPKIIGDKKCGILKSISKCSYCGGTEYYDYDDGNTALFSDPLEYTAIKIQKIDSDGKFELLRNICQDCLLKVFDKILGEPK